MSETPAPQPGSRTDDRTDGRTDDRTALESLVDGWLTLPDVAEELDLPVSKARSLVAERALVGIKRGERRTFQVPGAFLVDEDGERRVLATLRGTVLVLADAGLDDVEILRWLFETEPSIGAPPVQELRAGRRAAVRRAAQAL